MYNISYTRGNQFKMQLAYFHYYLREQLFSNGIIAVWNSLSNDFISADSTNIFKNRLDKFWFNQDLKFDWKAAIWDF